MRAVLAALFARQKSRVKVDQNLRRKQLMVLSSRKLLEHADSLVKKLRPRLGNEYLVWLLSSDAQHFRDFWDRKKFNTTRERVEIAKQKVIYKKLLIDRIVKLEGYLE
ncbi:MAG TPA: hypothetical protein VJG83_06835 [archaeon]|nr:hypothetical protein [archaeon]